MASSSLVLHKGARVVAREELDRVQTPPPTSTWFPLSHGAVVDRVTSTLIDAGFQPRRTQLALSQDNARFFGTIDLDSNVTAGVSLAVGVRNSIDKSLPIAMVAGSRVFVCDNLALRSQIIVVRKHTRFGETRFGEAICQAIGTLNEFRQSEGERIEHFQKMDVNDTLAESVILRAYERKIISHLFLPRILAEWRKPSFEAFEPRNMWSLQNAFTTPLGEMHKSNPQRFCGLTIALQGLLSEASGIVPQAHQPAEIVYAPPA